jgi:dihydrofolate reductase
MPTTRDEDTMRNLFVTEFISLDGVVEAPGGEEGYRHSGWTFDIEEDPARCEFKVEETFGTETLLLGRTTYEGFAAAWPERDGDFADKFNTMEKVVVSTTLDDPAWHNTTVVRDLDAVRTIKDGEGGPIAVHGSTTLARSLLEAGLVDQWNLMVFPVILGSGKRLFPTDAEDKQKLILRETRTYTNGIQLNIFETVR